MCKRFVANVMTVLFLIMGVSGNVVFAQDGWFNFDVATENCGYSVSIDGDQAAFLGYYNDDHLFYYDFVLRKAHDTGIDDAYDPPCIRGNKIAYHYRKWTWPYEQGIAIYDITTGAIFDTGISNARQPWGRNYFDGEHIVFEEKTETYDVNVKFYSLSDGTITDTGITYSYWASEPSIDGNFLTVGVAGQVALYNIAAGELTYLSEAGWDPVVRKNVVVYIDEFDELKYYKIDSETIHSTGVTDIGYAGFSTDGERIVYNISGEPLHVYDIAEDTITNTHHRGCSDSDTCWLEISGNYIAYERYEVGTNDGDRNQVYPPTDYNGDGEIDDCVAVWFPFIVHVAATIDLEPDTINPNSGGQYVTCFIELPEGYDVSKVDIQTVAFFSDVADVITDPAMGFAKPGESSVEDYDHDQILELMVKFDRADVMAVFGPEKNEVILQIAGAIDGELFAGSDTIRTTVNPGLTNKVGEEIQVNTETAGNQNQSAVAMDDRGNKVIVWTGSTGYSQYGANIYGQLYDSQDNPVGSNFQVNNYPYSSYYDTSRSPAVAMDDNGNFVVVWWGYGASGNAIYARLFDNAGVPLGDQFLISYYAHGSYPASVAMDSNGNFVVTWTYRTSWWYNKRTYLYAQLYDSSGAPRADRLVVYNVTSWQSVVSDVAMDPLGNFVVAWNATSNINARLYDSSGIPKASQFQVSTNPIYNEKPDVDMDSVGNFTIVWQGQTAGSSYSSILASRYNADGAPIGLEFQVSDPEYYAYSPAVAVNDRNTVITWHGYSEKGERYDILARKYDNAGIGGDVFMANTYTNSYQIDPAIAIDNRDEFTISWSSNYQDGSYYGVYCRSFDKFFPVD
ncbi:MAG: hypothetical protein JSU70_03505 [Phycisphaerales bacterium]|nr:MAG: hypothetical protein JSU70_03505 [Phycisphaerales bacterium]